jgi:hypothetical protein
VKCDFVKNIHVFQISRIHFLCFFILVLWFPVIHINDTRLVKISAVFRPLARLESIDTDSNWPQNDVLSLDGAHINEPISSRQSELPAVLLVNQRHLSSACKTWLHRHRPQNDVLSLDRRNNQLPPIRKCFMIFLGFTSMSTWTSLNHTVDLSIWWNTM